MTTMIKHTSRVVNRVASKVGKTAFIMALSVMLPAAVLVSSPVYAQQQFVPEQEAKISQAELDQILAPIALYPDTLLTHILIASTYPLEIVQAHRWAQENSHLNSDQILRNAEERDWDPSVQALTAFPDVLERLSENLDWTQAVGDAFLYDEEYVLSSIQNLRQKAQANGSLNDLEHLRVVNDGRDIVLEPVHREIIYAPYYDVHAVYGSWWWSGYPPVHLGFRSHSRGLRFIWGPRVNVGFRISFGAFSWGNRHIVRLNRGNFSYRNNFKRRQILSHSSSKRWIHNPVHRRGAYYRHARVNKRYTPNRSYRPSSRFAYRGNARSSKNISNARKFENKRRVTNVNQRLRDQRGSSPQRRPETSRNQQSRPNQVRNNQVRDNQARNNQARNTDSRNNQSRNNQSRNNQSRNDNRTAVQSNGTGAVRNDNRNNSQNRNNNASRRNVSSAPRSTNNARANNQRSNQGNAGTITSQRKVQTNRSGNNFRPQSRNSSNQNRQRSSSNQNKRFSQSR